MIRLRLDLSYDGTNFAGWASQPDQRTVQECLESALCTVLRLDSLRLVVAGRTDAGVHAMGQVAHLDLPDHAVPDGAVPDGAVPDGAVPDGAGLPEWEHGGQSLVRRLAGVLPADVRVHSVQRVSQDFDARFSALWRRYQYRISVAAHGVDPLLRTNTAAWKRQLDEVAMAQASHDLLGLHDFLAFCRRRDGAGTVRELSRLDVTRKGDVIVIDVQADAFCHSMVRSLVGALAAVGDGRQSRDWLRGLLSRDVRADDVTVAPANGLTLLQVGYPDAAQLATRALATRTVRIAPPVSRRAERLIDLSIRIETDMPVYPGDPSVELTSALSIAEHGVNVARVHLGSQTGTHVDAPSHTLSGGLRLAEIPLSRFLGPAVVADLQGLPARAPITAQLLAGIAPQLRPGRILLLCTGWSQYWGQDRYFDHPWLEPAATELILSCGIRAVGIDAPSIDPAPALNANTFPSHHLIGAAQGIIIENLRSLAEVLVATRHGREVEISVLPIKLDSGDGAPVRAVARVR